MNRINYLSEALKTADDNLQKMGGEALRSTYIISADSLAETALEANEKSRNTIATAQTTRIDSKLYIYASIFCCLKKNKNKK